MSAQLVTFEQAYGHLKLDATTAAAELADITGKLAQATALVLVHIAREENDWSTSTDPGADLEFAIVQAAILDVLGDLYRFRGDDADQPPEPPDAGAYLRANVRRKLHALRRVSLA